MTWPPYDGSLKGSRWNYRLQARAGFSPFKAACLCSVCLAKVLHQPKSRRPGFLLVSIQSWLGSVAPIYTAKCQCSFKSDMLGTKLATVLVSCPAAAAYLGWHGEVISADPIET